MVYFQMPVRTAPDRFHLGLWCSRSLFSLAFPVSLASSLILALPYDRWSISLSRERWYTKQAKPRRKTFSRCKHQRRTCFVWREIRIVFTVLLNFKRFRTFNRFLQVGKRKHINCPYRLLNLVEWPSRIPQITILCRLLRKPLIW